MSAPVPDLVRRYKRLAEVNAGSREALAAYADLKAAVLAMRMGKAERRALARVFKPSPGARTGPGEIGT